MNEEKNRGRKVSLVVGFPKTGKTTFLADKVLSLLSQGVPADDIIVFSSSDVAARELSERICERMPEGPSVNARSVMDFALGIISFAQEGDMPKLLSREEERILIGDASKTASNRSRAREIIKFLLREWTEMGDDKDGFFISSEERSLHDWMKARLREQNAIMRHEVSADALRSLRRAPEVARRFQRPYVVVDDYQNLCLASQLLCEELCTGHFIAAGDEGQRIESCDPYPYPDGLEKCKMRNLGEGFEEIELDSSFAGGEIAGATERFCRSSETLSGKCFPKQASAEGKLKLVRVKTLSSEAREVVECVRESVLRGHSFDDVMLVVPDGLRKRDLLAALTDSDVPAYDLSHPSADGGVAVGIVEEAAGLDRKVVLACDVVDGVYPSFRSLDQNESIDHRAYYHEIDERKFNVCISRATDLLVLFVPEGDELELVTEHHMKVSRIRAGKTGRIGLLRQSEFIPRITSHEGDGPKSFLGSAGRSDERKASND